MHQTTFNRRRQQRRRQQRRHAPNNFLRGDNKHDNNESADNNTVWGNDDATPKIKASPKPVWYEFEFGFELRNRAIK